MPGSKGNRTKGNVKPSSSSRAAELLSQSGTTGFVGFGSVGGAQAYVPASQAFDDVDSGCLDSDFRVVLRKLTKRDATTKIKTLGEFSTLCKEKDDSTLQAVLPFWPRLFNKLAIDVDPKVREYTQGAMATLVSRVRRNLAPYLKNVMGAWILSRNDTYPTVSSAANRSFSAAFPAEKQQNAIVFCKQAVLEYMIDNLLHQTPSTLSDPKTTEKEDMESKYQRVVSSSLMGLRQLLQALPSAHIDDGLKGHLRELLNNAKFWSLGKSQVPLVRSGLFWFLGSLCQVVPDVAGEFVHKISPLALGSVDVLEPGLTSAVWDALLSCVKFVPTCWGSINWQKAFWPKLRKVLESGCHGNAVSVAPNFLPLFSCIPMETAGGAAAFFPKVLDLFKEGFAKDCVANSPSETNAWTKAFMECLQFAFRQISSAGEASRHEVLQAVLLDQLLPIMEASLFDPKPTLSRSVLNTCVSSFLRTVAANPDTSALAAVFWTHLSADVVEMFESVGSGEQQSVRPDRIVTFAKTLLYPQQDASSMVSGGSKSERVRFAGNESRREQNVCMAGEVSDEVKCFVKKVVVGSHRLYQKDGQTIHFKLFVDLANLYFPEDMATFVLHSLESQGDSCAGAGEGSAQAGEGRLESVVVVDAHSKVIDVLVLPVLGGEERGEEVVDHSITLLFACLPYLSKKRSTDVWDSVLQTVSGTGALCCLVERALEKRRIMPQVSGWLSSACLHARLRDLVAVVTSQHSTLPTEELEQGWKMICLVLSANDDSEPVFPAEWIADIVSSVCQELRTLASRPLGQQEIQVAMQFVAKAALTFFQNLKMSLCLSEGRDVIVALLMADLDCSLSISGEAACVVRQAWTAGLGLAVLGTGGFLQDGSILSAVCRIVRDALLTKTHTTDQYRQVVEVTEEVLKTTQNHLPKDDSDDAYNPLLLAVVSELVVPVSVSTADDSKIVQHHCLTGQLPLTLLDSLPAGGADHSSSMGAVVFSSLFNLHLLRCVRSGLRLEADGDAVAGGESDQPAEKPGEWEEREEGVVFDVMKALVLASCWCTVEPQAPPDVVSAVNDLTNVAPAFFSSTSAGFQQAVTRTAFHSIKDHPVDSLTCGYLAELQCTQSPWLSVNEELDDSSLLETEVLVPFLFQQKIADLFQCYADRLTTLTDGSLQTSGVSYLRILRAALTREPELILSQCDSRVQDVVTMLKTWRDHDSALFLFSCDVCEEAVGRVGFNVAVMEFLTAVLSCGHFTLQPDLWDFILCSLVSWVESVDNSNMSLHSSLTVQAFTVAACRLVAAVAGAVQRPVVPEGDVYPPSLRTEWSEFFAEGIYSFLFPLFITLVGQLKEPKTAEARAAVVLSTVGSAMSLCPQGQVTGHHLPLRLVACDDTSPVPESLQSLLNHLCPMLTCQSPQAQVTAFCLLDRIITLLPTYHKEQDQEAGASANTSTGATVTATAADRSELEPRAPPAALMKVIDDCATAMDVVLTTVPMETTIAVVPGTEEYQFALGYLLAWQLVLHLFHSAESMGRAEYAAYLKQHSSVRHLLEHLFRLMPHSPSAVCSGTATPPSSARWCGGEEKFPSRPVARQLLEGEEKREWLWFGSSDLPLTPAGVGRMTDVQRASCRVYVHCLEVIPVLVRRWWKDQDRKSAAYIDKFTTKYVSQHLIRSEMTVVNSAESTIKDLVVKASTITRQVTATYTAEELRAEIRVTLPENFPLGEITVDAQRHAVVKLAEWDRLLLQVNVFLQHQNGPIIEGLKIWKRNIDKKLEGVEECYICYAVIHATNLDLPRIPCGTCKKKFHSSCLYKWLNSSQNATCPLCRSVLL
ncbi:E3 ubiquitin-protein ligase listerin-like isoform X2 [Babylonia areolata]|uniref:E3 ubiquitin-protein ligase listerin-like isoform X2 n=1 Tax=Babylonia areolata TaxID=304850 RepID=UPI003FCF1AE9